LGDIPPASPPNVGTLPLSRMTHTLSMSASLKLKNFRGLPYYPRSPFSVCGTPFIVAFKLGGISQTLKATPLWGGTPQNLLVLQGNLSRGLFNRAHIAALGPTKPGFPSNYPLILKGPKGSSQG